LIQGNRLGDLTKVNAWSGAPAIPYNLPEEEVPYDLDWQKWLGPLPYVHYNPELNPPISLDPIQNEEFWGGWRWYQETGGGFITDWGAHMFDIAQWALGKELSGPVDIIPAGHSGTDYIDFIYDDGLVMANAPFTENETFGVRFESDSAWIEVHRGQFRASDESLLPRVAGEDEVEEYETASPHLVDFLSCVKSRQEPIAPIEAGHRTNTVGVLGNIATQLNRPLKWNPDQERFVDDSEADSRLHYDYREGYSF
jgi:predicted dehydrogenase